MFSFLTRLVVRRYQPMVIAIAGTVGKTTKRRAIESVLRKTVTVRTGKLLDNDARAAIRTILYGGLGRGLSLLLRRAPDYPRAILLEYRASQEGDMMLCGSITQPDIVVLTSLAPSGVDAFRSVDRMVKETTHILQCVKRDGWTVLNVDDARVQSVKSRVKGRVMTYGIDASADVRAIEVSVTQKVIDGAISVEGTSFKLVYKGSAVPVHLPGALDGPHVSAALAAAAVGIIMEINLVNISEALRSYSPTPGRMHLLPGIKRTMLIDDTYNASPASALIGLQGLDVLAVRPGAEKFAVLGDMVPLGDYTEQGHREVGERLSAMHVDYLVTVGKLSRDIGRAAREKGIPEERVYHFTTPEEAGRFVQERLEEGDCVYVTGNAGLRMEKVVKELMADPLRAKALLVER